MSGETPDRGDDIALAGEYALGLLPEDEATAFELRLKTEPELRAILIAWVEDMARMADGVDPVVPPESVLRRIETRLFGDMRRAWPGLFSKFAVIGAMTAVLAVLLFVATGLLDRAPVMPEEPDYRATITAEDRSLVVAAAYDRDSAELFIERETGEARPGRALELWLIAGDDPPVSLGVLPDDTRTVVRIAPPLRPALEGGVLAISDEPPGGSTTGAPTGAVLAVGPITGA